MFNIRPLHKYLAFFIISVFFSIAFLILLAIVLAHPGIYPGNNIINTLILGFLLITFVTLSSLSLRSYFNQKQFIRRLKIENSYTLGVETAFYNLESLKMRVFEMRKKYRYRNKKQYIVAFTPTSLDISSNRLRNKELMALNVELAHYITFLFENEKNEFYQKDNVYAFNRGIFLIYMFTDSIQTVQGFIQTMSNKMYKTVDELKLKLWVQPFYGVKEVTSEDIITSAVEDALIARNASEANYEQYTIFNKTLFKETSSSLEEISKALDNDELVPFFQPKYSLKEKRFISSEVLARWDSPKYGLVGPNRFIQRAQQAGLLSAIDIFIFKKAVKYLGESLRKGKRVLPVSVNFSLYEFFSRNFLNMVIETLEINKVPANLIEIEITETTSQANKFLSLSVIKKLKEMGIRVLMDDFGVGYSQINSLQEIPFDAIKIDKSFTDHILDEEKSRSMVRFLVELGHLNDMEVIIEGVENKEQVDLLKKLKVDTIQGFYYSKALSYKEYNDFLRYNDFEKQGV